jgi:hypothetical protein
MSIKVSCPHCDREYTLPDSKEGKTLRCKGCQETFVARRGRARQDEDDRPRRARKSAADEDENDRSEEERPRRKKRGVPMWLWLAGGGGVIVAATVVILVVVLGGGSGGNITNENLQKIKNGMLEADVRAILGAPSYAVNDPTNPTGKLNPEEVKFRANKTLVWQSGSNRIHVDFFEGRVTGALWNPPLPGEPGGAPVAGLSEANFKRLRRNMPEVEVRQILGIPKERLPGSSTWESGDSKVTANFANGKLLNATGQFGNKTVTVPGKGS